MNSEIEKRLSALEMRLDLEFKNRALLLEAVTHRSYLNEHPDHPVGHNERLEFLGDAALLRRSPNLSGSWTSCS